MMRVVLMVVAALVAGCTVRVVDEDCADRARKTCGIDDACVGREEARCPDAGDAPPDDDG